MSLSQEQIEFSRDMTKTYIVNKLTQDFKLLPEKALVKFMKTKTYELLQSDKSSLYTESFEFVYTLLTYELNDDWDNWYNFR